MLQNTTPNKTPHQLTLMGKGRYILLHRQHVQQGIDCSAITTSQLLNPKAKPTNHQ